MAGSYVGKSSGSAIKGHDPFALFTFPFQGLDGETGDPIGLFSRKAFKDYQAIFNQPVDSARLVNNGSALPRVFGSLNNIFSWKDLTMIISLQYRFRYSVLKSVINYSQMYSANWSHPDFSQRWQQPGDEKKTDIPSMPYPADGSRDQFYSLTDINVFKGDNIRLQQIRLEYNLSLRRVTRNTVKKALLYTSAENLGFVWRANSEKLDPDVQYGRNAYPMPIRLGGGVKLDF